MFQKTFSTHGIVVSLLIAKRNAKKAQNLWLPKETPTETPPSAMLKQTVNFWPSQQQQMAKEEVEDDFDWLAIEPNSKTDKLILEEENK